MFHKLHLSSPNKAASVKGILTHFPVCHRRQLRKLLRMILVEPGEMGMRTRAGNFIILNLVDTNL